MNRKIILILIIVLLAIVLYVWGIKKNTTDPKFFASQENQLKATNLQTDKTQEINNWQTYIDKDYGFEFQYPSDLEKKRKSILFF